VDEKGGWISSSQAVILEATPHLPKEVWSPVAFSLQAEGKEGKTRGRGEGSAKVQPV